jgi:hypothetical protein
MSFGYPAVTAAPSCAAPVGAVADARTTARHGLYGALALLLSAPIVYVFYWPSANGLDVTGHAVGRDFINVWAGTRLAFGGQLAVLFDMEGFRAAISRLFGHPLPFHSWSYPPHALALFWPFAQLSYFPALVAWTLSSFSIFAAVVLGQLEAHQRIGALVLLLLAPASLINILGGQNGFFSAALLLGGVLAIDRRPVVAGVLFGLLTCKPHLGLVLPFVLLGLGRWRVIAVATSTTVALIALSLVLFGSDAWRSYVETTGPYHVSTLYHWHGFYTAMMVSVLTGARTFGIPFAAAVTLQFIVALPVLALTVWAIRKTTDPCRRAFVIASAAPLVTPYAFNYDLTAVAAVLVWVLAGRLPTDQRWRMAYPVAWALPLLSMYLSMVGIGIAPLIQFGLFVLAVQAAVGSPHRAVRPSGMTAPP